MPREDLQPGPEAALYAHLMAHVRAKTEAVGRGERLPIHDTVALARHLLTRLADPGPLLAVCTGYYAPADLVVSHAVNVSLFALQMARAMRRSAEEIEDTLVAGLLHDVGFGAVPAFRLTPEALALLESQPEGLVTRANRQLVEGHSAAGYAAIVRDSPQAERVAEIVWEHHERADGQGYPRGLKEAEQRVPSRILAIIDIYEALIHPRPFRDALVPPRGIDAITRERPGAFSAEMLKALLRALPPFPLGYHVRLSDGSIARVTGIAPDAPLRPDVTVIARRGGEALAPPLAIRLRESSLLYITECLPRRRVEAC
jgi:HD-GYP domain-containing protein (c-di-GMP phosphodiesterase class II)